MLVIINCALFQYCLYSTELFGIKEFHICRASTQWVHIEFIQVGRNGYRVSNWQSPLKLLIWFPQLIRFLLGY